MRTINHGDLGTPLSDLLKGQPSSFHFCLTWSPVQRFYFVLQVKVTEGAEKNNNGTARTLTVQPRSYCTKDTPCFSRLKNHGAFPAFDYKLHRMN